MPPDPDRGGDAPETLDWHEIAEARRIHIERLQGRRLFLVAARVLDAWRRVAGRVLVPVETVRALASLVVTSLVAVPRRITVSRRQRELIDALRRLPDVTLDPAAPRVEDVTAVIVTAHQPERLHRLLSALGRAGIRSVVVDNAGDREVSAVVDAHPDAWHVRIPAPRSYAEANAVGIAEVVTPWVVLLNDDVEPLHDDWFERLRAAVLPGDGRPEAAAVGAVLVHGRRGWLGGRAVDATVQHAGIATVLEGPLARPVHLGRGEVPRPRAGAVDVLAVTGACLLARVDAIDRVGGLHQRYDYGLEDVDLCLALGSLGPIRVATDALLLHEEGATRLRGDRRRRSVRQAANRVLFDSRHGPVLRARAIDALVTGEDRVAAPSRGLAIAVSGDVPVQDVLRRMDAFDVVRHRRGGASPAVHVIGSGGVAPRDPDVPVVGWASSAAVVSVWPDALLDACDIVVTAEGDPDGRIAERAPTLPVERLAEDASVEEVTGLLLGVLRRPRWSLRIGSPSGRRGDLWGDTSLARTLRCELRAHGLVVRIARRSDWAGPADRGADVVLTIKGRGIAPPAAPAQHTIVWVMSHPSEIAPGELEGADLVLAGSDLLAATLRTMTTSPVHVLPQAVDARRFRPGETDPARTTDVLFLGNSRSVPRPVVMAAVRAGLPLTVIGDGWHRFIDRALVRATSVPADELPRWYRSAGVVLNDHWDEMRRWGLVSNRVFEVLACGGLVVSDHVPGIDALTGGAVATYDDPEELAGVVAPLLADPSRRRELAERGRAAVLAAHTWEHRAATLVSLVGVVQVRG